MILVILFKVPEKWKVRFGLPCYRSSCQHFTFSCCTVWAVKLCTVVFQTPSRLGSHPFT